MNNKDKLILGLFLIFILLAGGFLWWLNSEGETCLVKPYIYVYKNINPLPYYCSCIIENGQFVFNSTDYWFTSERLFP